VIRRLPLAVLAMLSAAFLTAYRPYGLRARPEAAWMTVSSLKTGREYYLEVSEDGSAVMREETQTSLITRRGTIAKQLVSDFFREIDNSEVINSQGDAGGKLVFYRGDMLKISAYINGELTRTSAPLKNFGDAFAYAFGEVRKAVAALPQERKLKAFLRAVPATGEDLASYRPDSGRGGDGRIVEPAEIMKVKPLMSAIEEPYRLIPIEDEAGLKQLQDFVSAKQLHGLRTLFYLPSTRGTFKCQVLDAWRGDLAAGDKAGKDAKKARRRLRRPRRRPAEVK
jgi:uncharacterized protein with PIN domain